MLWKKDKLVIITVMTKNGDEMAKMGRGERSQKSEVKTSPIVVISTLLTGRSRPRQALVLPKHGVGMRRNLFFFLVCCSYKQRIAVAKVICQKHTGDQAKQCGIYEVARQGVK